MAQNAHNPHDGLTRSCMKNVQESCNLALMFLFLQDSCKAILLTSPCNSSLLITHEGLKIEAPDPQKMEVLSHKFPAFHDGCPSLALCPPWKFANGFEIECMNIRYMTFFLVKYLAKGADTEVK